MNATILFVEDEKILGRLVAEALEKQGYEVVLLTNGNDVLHAFRERKPQLCLFDVMLPGKDGFAVAQQVRNIDTRVPILFLTAKVQAADVVEGFKAGCNDYIRKPFSIDELLVRVQSWLKEKYGGHEPEPEDSYILGGIIFHPQKQLLEINDKKINLTYKESAVLALLYAHRNTIIGRDYLLQKVWADDTHYNSRTLDVYMNRLRKYFAGSSNKIITLKGIGYRFICE